MEKAQNEQLEAYLGQMLRQFEGAIQRLQGEQNMRIVAILELIDVEYRLKETLKVTLASVECSPPADREDFFRFAVKWLENPDNANLFDPALKRKIRGTVPQLSQKKYQK